MFVFLFKMYQTRASLRPHTCICYTFQLRLFIPVRSFKKSAMQLFLSIKILQKRFKIRQSKKIGQSMYTKRMVQHNQHRIILVCKVLIPALARDMI